MDGVQVLKTVDVENAIRQQQLEEIRQIAEQQRQINEISSGINQEVKFSEESLRRLKASEQPNDLQVTNLHFDNNNNYLQKLMKFVYNHENVATK